MKIKNFFKALLQKFGASWLFLCTMAIIIFLVCGIVFIANYSIAYNDDTNGNIFAPSDTVILHYFFIVIFSILFCIVFKIKLKNKIRIWSALLCAILLPVLCYNLNYRIFKSDSPLYPLVDKGGALHFMMLKEDRYKKYYDTLFTERTHSCVVVSTAAYHELFGDIYVETTGTGPGLDTSTRDYMRSKYFFKFLMDTTRTKYSKFTLTITLKSQDYNDQLAFYVSDGSEQKQLIKHSFIEDDNLFSNDKKVFIEIDAKTIKKFYNTAKNGTFKMVIVYNLISDAQ